MSAREHGKGRRGQDRRALQASHPQLAQRGLRPANRLLHRPAAQRLDLQPARARSGASGSVTRQRAKSRRGVQKGLTLGAARPWPPSLPILAPRQPNCCQSWPFRQSLLGLVPAGMAGAAAPPIRGSRGQEREEGGRREAEGRQKGGRGAGRRGGLTAAAPAPRTFRYSQDVPVYSRPTCTRIFPGCRSAWMRLSTSIMCSMVRAPSTASSLLYGAPGPLRGVGGQGGA